MKSEMVERDNYGLCFKHDWDETTKRVAQFRVGKKIIESCKNCPAILKIMDVKE